MIVESNEDGQGSSLAERIRKNTENNRLRREALIQSRARERCRRRSFLELSQDTTGEPHNIMSELYEIADLMALERERERQERDVARAVRYSLKHEKAIARLTSRMRQEEGNAADCTPSSAAAAAAAAVAKPSPPHWKVEEDRKTYMLLKMSVAMRSGGDRQNQNRRHRYRKSTKNASITSRTSARAQPWRPGRRSRRARDSAAARRGRSYEDDGGNASAGGGLSVSGSSLGRNQSWDGRGASPFSAGGKRASKRPRRRTVPRARERSGASHERTRPGGTCRAAPRRNEHRRATQKKRHSPSRQPLHVLNGPIAVPLPISPRRERAAARRGKCNVKETINEEEDEEAEEKAKRKENRRGPGSRVAPSTSLEGISEWSSTVDLRAGSTVDLGTRIASSVDLEESSWDRASKTPNPRAKADLVSHKSGDGGDAGDRGSLQGLVEEKVVRNTEERKICTEEDDRDESEDRNDSCRLIRAGASAGGRPRSGPRLKRSVVKETSGRRRRRDGRSDHDNLSDNSVTGERRRSPASCRKNASATSFLAKRPARSDRGLPKEHLSISRAAHVTGSQVPLVAGGTVAATGGGKLAASEAAALGAHDTLSLEALPPKKIEQHDDDAAASGHGHASTVSRSSADVGRAQKQQGLVMCRRGVVPDTYSASEKEAKRVARELAGERKAAHLRRARHEQRIAIKSKFRGGGGPVMIAMKPIEYAGGECTEFALDLDRGNLHVYQSTRPGTRGNHRVVPMSEVGVSVAKRNPQLVVLRWSGRHLSTIGQGAWREICGQGVAHRKRVKALRGDGAIHAHVGGDSVASARPSGSRAPVADAAVVAATLSLAGWGGGSGREPDWSPEMVDFDAKFATEAFFTRPRTRNRSTPQRCGGGGGVRPIYRCQPSPLSSRWTCSDRDHAGGSRVPSSAQKFFRRTAPAVDGGSGGGDSDGITVSAFGGDSFRRSVGYETSLPPSTPVACMSRDEWPSSFCNNAREQSGVEGEQTTGTAPKPVRPAHAPRRSKQWRFITHVGHGDSNVSTARDSAQRTHATASRQGDEAEGMGGDNRPVTVPPCVGGGEDERGLTTGTAKEAPKSDGGGIGGKEREGHSASARTWKNDLSAAATPAASASISAAATALAPAAGNALVSPEDRQYHAAPGAIVGEMLRRRELAEGKDQPRRSLGLQAAPGVPTKPEATAAARPTLGSKITPFLGSIVTSRSLARTTRGETAAAAHTPTKQVVSFLSDTEPASSHPRSGVMRGTLKKTTSSSNVCATDVGGAGGGQSWRAVAAEVKAVKAFRARKPTTAAAARNRGSAQWTRLKACRKSASIIMRDLNEVGDSVSSSSGGDERRERCQRERVGDGSGSENSSSLWYESSSSECSSSLESSGCLEEEGGHDNTGMMYRSRGSSSSSSSSSSRRRSRSRSSSDSTSSSNSTSTSTSSTSSSSSSTSTTSSNPEQRGIVRPRTVRWSRREGTAVGGIRSSTNMKERSRRLVRGAMTGLRRFFTASSIVIAGIPGIVQTQLVDILAKELPNVDVRIVADLASTIQTVQIMPPSVVVVAWAMFASAKAAREFLADSGVRSVRGNSPGLPVAVVGGENDGEGLRISLEAMGASAVLLWPYKTDDVTSMLEKCLSICS